MSFTSCFFPYNTIIGFLHLAFNNSYSVGQNSNRDYVKRKVLQTAQIDSVTNKVTAIEKFVFAKENNVAIALKFNVHVLIKINEFFECKPSNS